MALRSHQDREERPAASITKYEQIPQLTHPCDLVTDSVRRPLASHKTDSIVWITCCDNSRFW
jgi:hypothetical protein